MDQESEAEDPKLKALTMLLQKKRAQERQQALKEQQEMELNLIPE